MRRIILWSCIPRSITGVRGMSTLMFVYISASIRRKARVLSPTSAYNSSKKTLKKTLRCNRSVFELCFFFKAGGLYSRGGLARSLRRLSVHGPVPVPVEHILPLPMIIRSWWPYILITAPAHCDMQNWSGLLPKTEAGMPMRWTWTGRQPQLSVFPLSSSPWLLGLLEWGDWVYVIIE